MRRDSTYGTRAHENWSGIAYPDTLDLYCGGALGDYHHGSWHELSARAAVGEGRPGSGGVLRRERHRARREGRGDDSGERNKWIGVKCEIRVL